MTLQTLAVDRSMPGEINERKSLQNICAALSMLHEPEIDAADPACRNSATRLFRQKPVLAQTLDRLKKCARIKQVVVLCWEDQLATARPIVEKAGCEIRSLGRRAANPWLSAITAARKWADGWRGGLLGTCEFDRGLHPAALRDLAAACQADALLLVDPAAALVDTELIDAVLSQADQTPRLDLFFTPAAPGLCGVLLRAELLDQLAAAPPNAGHPGRYLHYLPDAPTADPIAGEGCAQIPTRLARTAHRFCIDSDRQLHRLERAAQILNQKGCDAPAASAQQWLDAIDQSQAADKLPREIVLELTTRRASKPIFSPAGRLGISRPDMTAARAAALLKEIAVADDMRLTLAGVGDAVLCEEFIAIANLAQAAGVHAIRVETDLLGCDKAKIAALAAAPIDVVAVNLPAVTPQTYAAVMGVDAMLEAVTNLRELLLQRHLRQSGTPIVVPVFVKCRQNIEEMEAWYDQWLRALGSAAIVGPSDFAGQIADVAVADMAPGRRVACRRLDKRLMILSDGGIVACEQDALARRILGKVGSDRIADVWKTPCGMLRSAHAAGRFDDHPLCGACREWHRP